MDTLLGQHFKAAAEAAPVVTQYDPAIYAVGVEKIAMVCVGALEDGRTAISTMTPEQIQKYAQAIEEGRNRARQDFLAEIQDGTYQQKVAADLQEIEAEDAVYQDVIDDPAVAETIGDVAQKIAYEVCQRMDFETRTDEKVQEAVIDQAAKIAEAVVLNGDVNTMTALAQEEAALSGGQ